MSEPVKIKIRYTQFSPGVLELRTIARGRFFKRRYVGYKKVDAVGHFKIWLKEQLR